MLVTGGRTLQVTSSGALTPVPPCRRAPVPLSSRREACHRAPSLPQGGPYSHFLRRNQRIMPRVNIAITPSTP